LWDGVQYKVGEVLEHDVWQLLSDATQVAEELGYAPLTVLYEQFHHRQGASKVDTAPARVIGVIQEWARQNRKRITALESQPSSMQQEVYFTKDRMKKAGLWKSFKRGKNDAMSALRHLLIWRKDMLL
jgi:hypothetical protein